MKLEKVKGLDEEKFRRLTGVKRKTFDRMVGILEQANKDRVTNRGRKVTVQMPFLSPIYRSTGRL